MIGNDWDGEWKDVSTGKLMVGRGTEFWTMRDGKVSIWEAAFNVWERNAHHGSHLRTGKCSTTHHGKLGPYRLLCTTTLTGSPSR